MYKTQIFIGVAGLLVMSAAALAANELGEPVWYQENWNKYETDWPKIPDANERCATDAERPPTQGSGISIKSNDIVGGGQWRGVYNDLTSGAWPDPMDPGEVVKPVVGNPITLQTAGYRVFSNKPCGEVNFEMTLKGPSHSVAVRAPGGSLSVTTDYYEYNINGTGWIDTTVQIIQGKTTANWWDALYIEIDVDHIAIGSDAVKELLDAAHPNGDQYEEVWTGDFTAWQFDTIEFSSYNSLTTKAGYLGQITLSGGEIAVYTEPPPPPPPPPTLSYYENLNKFGQTGCFDTMSGYSAWPLGDHANPPGIGGQEIKANDAGPYGAWNNIFAEDHWSDIAPTGGFAVPAANPVTLETSYRVFSDKPVGEVNFEMTLKGDTHSVAIRAPGGSLSTTTDFYEYSIDGGTWTDTTVQIIQNAYQYWTSCETPYTPGEGYSNWWDLPWIEVGVDYVKIGADRLDDWSDGRCGAECPVGTQSEVVATGDYTGWQFDTIEIVCDSSVVTKAGYLAHFALSGDAGAPVPAVTSAYSVKQHGTVGEFKIDVLDRTNGNDIESRRDGATKLEVNFDRNVFLATGTAADISLSSGTVSSVSKTADQQIIVLLGGTTNGAGLTVGFPGVENAYGDACTDTICVRQLVGDVRGTRIIDAFDRLDARNAMIAIFDSTNFRVDTDMDATFSAFDRLDVRNAMGAGIYIPENTCGVPDP